VQLGLSTDEPYIATITHSGEGNFSVWAIDEDGNRLELLVNTIGNYKGVRPLNLTADPAVLEIDADGDWQVRVQMLDQAPVWNGKAAGTGPAVLLVDQSGVSGLTTVRITHSGESNFVVWAYGDTSDLLVNEIGEYSGEELLSAGTVVLDIEADGDWTVERG
jgi:hypothetical protein